MFAKMQPALVPMCLQHAGLKDDSSQVCELTSRASGAKGRAVLATAVDAWFQYVVVAIEVLKTPSRLHIEREQAVLVS